MHDRAIRVLLIFTALSAAAAPAPKPKPAFVPPGPGNPYWLKIYPTAPYREIWTGELALRDFDAGLPKALKAIEKSGGALVQPLATFAGSRKDKFQQLSFSLPRAAAKELLKSLRRLGDMPDPAVQPLGAPIPIREVREKIDLLMKEKTEQADALKKVPAAAAAAEEILDHLLLVREVAERADAEVRFNLTARQK